MGLGKTLQTIGLVHTVCTNFPKLISTVLIICPINTAKNWKDEFEKWLTNDLEMDVYEMTNDKDNWCRSERLAMWKREGKISIRLCLER